MGLLQSEPNNKQPHVNDISGQRFGFLTINLIERWALHYRRGQNGSKYNSDRRRRQL